MDKVESRQLLEDWADHWELDIERDVFKVVCREQLEYQVRKENLTFDATEEAFSYKLKKPIKGADGAVAIIAIHETTMEEKKVLQRFGDDESIDAATALLAKYTSLKPSEVSQLMDRDTTVINAVISGFITQILPEKKR